MNNKHNRPLGLSSPSDCQKQASTVNFKVLSVFPAVQGFISSLKEQVLKVYYLPGVPGVLQRSFQIRIAHLDPENFILSGEGIFPRICLDLPRNLKGTTTHSCFPTGTFQLCFFEGWQLINCIICLAVFSSSLLCYSSTAKKVELKLTRRSEFSETRHGRGSPKFRSLASFAITGFLIEASGNCTSQGLFFQHPLLPAIISS